MNNMEDFNKKIENYIKNFSEKIKKININNIDKDIIEKTKIIINNKEKKIEEISCVEKDEQENIIIKPINKENLKIIEKEIKKNNKYNSIITFKDFIKINRNIITKEKIKEIIRIIKNEKEKIKIILRNFRRKEKNEKNIKEIQKIIEKNEKKIEEIYENKIKNIK